MFENEEKRFEEDFEGVKWQGSDKSALKEVSQDLKKELQNEAMKRYSPIGTVVGIKDDDQKYMIIGFNGDYDFEKKDYLACPYPTGIGREVPIIGFNHEDIAVFYSVGYFDMLGRGFQAKLNEQERGMDARSY